MTRAATRLCKASICSAFSGLQSTYEPHGLRREIPFIVSGKEGSDPYGPQGPSDSPSVIFAIKPVCRDRGCYYTLDQAISKVMFFLSESFDVNGVRC